MDEVAEGGFGFFGAGFAAGDPGVEDATDGGGGGFLVAVLAADEGDVVEVEIGRVGVAVWGGFFFGLEEGGDALPVVFHCQEADDAAGRADEEAFPGVVVGHEFSLREAAGMGG